MNHKRCAIIGTAASWELMPWEDVSLEAWGLNDAYQMQGWQRANRWYDLHPLDHFVYPNEKKQIDLANLPPSYYLRPRVHLDWLGQQAIPIYLNADHATQHPPSAAWAHARVFPRAEIEAHFGRYFGSTPAWMLAHAVMDGYREIHIYGIHLATQHEYVEQRPNFEFLLGRVLGPGKSRLTISGGLRRYESDDGILILPVVSPLLSHTHQYAFEARPRQQMEKPQLELQKLGIKRDRLVKALLHRKPWDFYRVGRWKDQLARLDARALDCQQQLQRIEYAISEQVVM